VYRRLNGLVSRPIRVLFDVDSLAIGGLEKKVVRFGARPRPQPVRARARRGLSNAISRSHELRLADRGDTGGRNAGGDRRRYLRHSRPLAEAEAGSSA
jgi:hypothetical protein